MTFLEFLKKEKEINPKTDELMKLMDLYYDEYTAYMRAKKDGCGDDGKMPPQQ